MTPARGRSADRCPCCGASPGERRPECVSAERDRYKAALDGIAAALSLKPGESHKGCGAACGEDACVPCWLHALAVANGGDDG